MAQTKTQPESTTEPDAASQQPWRNRIVRYSDEAPESLLANPKNWRAHPDHQADALRGVLQDVGVVQNVIVNQRTGFLIDGHLRVALAIKTRQPTIPVTWVDLSESEEALVLATIDPLSAMADTNGAQLAALLEEVSTDNPALQLLLDSLAREAGLELDTGSTGGGGDEFDGRPQEGPTRTQPGELWVIAGVHRLLVGDCTDPELVAYLMQGQQPRLMVTDPPYGVNYDPSWRAEAGINNNTERMGTVENDERFDWREAYEAFQAQVLYVWHAGKYSGEVQLSIIEAGYQIVSQIIWCKDKFALSRGDYHWQHEPCWYAVREDANHNWQGARDQSTVWHIKRENVDEGEWGHGTQKPLECMLRPIENNTSAGDIVVDPFLGTGTTLIAVHRMKRVCYGMEIAPAYADVILRRAEAEGLTVERATLASGESEVQ